MQLLRVMNDLWRREGLDMQMMLYDCISTGFERGLLQVVPNAKTLGNILTEATDKVSSGLAGAIGLGWLVGDCCLLFVRWVEMLCRRYSQQSLTDCSVSPHFSDQQRQVWFSVPQDRVRHEGPGRLLGARRVDPHSGRRGGREQRGRGCQGRRPGQVSVMCGVCDV